MAVAVLVLSALSSHASGLPAGNSGAPASADKITAKASTVVAKKTGLSPAERARYQELAMQSQSLATGEAAGASDDTKLVLIVVGGVVLAAAIVAGAHYAHPAPLIDIN